LHSIKELEKYKNPFIGIIGSNHRGEELKPFKKYASDYFDKGGGMIYVYDKNDEVQILDYLKRSWGVDLDYLRNKNRIIFICRNDYLLDNHIDGEGFLRGIEKGLEKLKKTGSKEKSIYMNVDSFWDSIVKNNIQYFYNKIKIMCRERKTRFIFRYIIEELNDEYIDGLLKNHTILLVDGVNDFEIYSPKELLSQSLTLLSRHNTVSRKYEKEMMRIEYLKTLGEMMEDTVHDINNLLITISGYAELSLIVEDPNEVENYLNIIHRTALDGKSITDRIQNHIRGSYNSSKDIYEFDYIINSCIEMTKHKFKPSINNKGKLKLVVDLNSNSCIYANEYEVRQAIINIILNGVDAMEGSGVLTVKTYSTENKVVLEISDTGKGMDDITKKKIFEPYFTTKGVKGTGLGLNIAKKVFDNHMAKVHIDSQIGKGTKFTIYFPIKEITM
jgi:signal transduction histidine kinase